MSGPTGGFSAPAAHCGDAHAKVSLAAALQSGWDGNPVSGAGPAGAIRPGCVEPAGGAKRVGGATVGATAGWAALLPRRLRRRLERKRRCQLLRGIRQGAAMGESRPRPHARGAEMTTCGPV